MLGRGRVSKTGLRKAVTLGSWSCEKEEGPKIAIKFRIGRNDLGLRVSYEMFLKKNWKEERKKYKRRVEKHEAKKEKRRS